MQHSYLHEENKNFTFEIKEKICRYLLQIEDPKVKIELTGLSYDIFSHLWYSSSCSSSICLPPVSSGKWIFQATSNGFRLDGKLQIDVLSIINTLHHDTYAMHKSTKKALLNGGGKNTLQQDNLLYVTSHVSC